MKFSSIYLFFIAIIAQIYFPKIYLFSTIFSIDFLLILLTVYGLQYKRFYSICLGFLLGLCQDFLFQNNLLGAFSISKSISGYGLVVLYNRDKVWGVKVKYFYIFMLYFFHNSIYYYLKLSSLIEFESIFKLILIQSVISLIILELINVLLYGKKLIR